MLLVGNNCKDQPWRGSRLVLLRTVTVPAGGALGSQVSSSRTIRTPCERSTGGFTLIELLIVIVVTGILAAIVVFSVGGMTKNGASTACRQTLNEAQTAVETFYANSGTSTYPTTIGSLVPSYLKAAPSLAGVTFTMSGSTVEVSLSTSTGPATC